MYKNSYSLLLFIFLIGCLCIPRNIYAQPTPYRNLVFEGGGVRGLAYAGALEVLQEQGILQHIDQVAGTSVGAVSALLIAVGYTPAEIKTIMEELKIQSFNDGRFIFFGGFYRFFHHYGWYRGDRFERWVGKLVAAKTGNTDLNFTQLHALHIAN